ncbi:MAG: hypothetical protein HYX67_00875 [Candidatus Melainabacteria bacterium]|nr:hypothetical protein [Candidatus Melainabacteria bacterium]
MSVEPQESRPDPTEESKCAPSTATGPSDPGSCLERHDWPFRLKSAFHAISYLSRMPRAHFREPDKGTELFLVGALVVVAVLLFTPANYLNSMILFCDVLFGTTLLMFITHRFGIINTLSPKQAALVWDLIVSISLFVLFVVVHLTAVYFILRGAAKI